jgi:hypothetical protein
MIWTFTGFVVVLGTAAAAAEEEDDIANDVNDLIPPAVVTVPEVLVVVDKNETANGRTIDEKLETIL